MNADKMKEYRSGMVNIKNDKTVLDFTGIDNALKNAESMAYYKGKVKDPTAADVLQNKPQRAPQRGVGARALAEAIEPCVKTQLRRQRSVDDDPRRR